MKKLILTLTALAATLCLYGQPAGGFGGFQMPRVDVHCSDKIADVDYADDGEVFHQLDIYYPRVEKAAYPVVIHIYGSAWYSNNSKGMADLGTIVNALLDAGYAVVTPNHRSSQDAKFPAQIEDIKGVIRFVRANADKYRFDTSFIATSGFSSGGHLSSLAATSGNVPELEGAVGGNLGFSSRVDAACDWSGPVDLNHMSCDAAEDTWNHAPEEAVMGFPFKGNEERFKALNATNYIDPSDPPVIIFHGTADNVVPCCQAPWFYGKLVDAGVTSEMHLVDGGGHGMGMYAAENLGAMVTFLDRIRTKRYADSSTSLEKYLIPAAAAPATPDEEGFLRRWMLLDPISKPNRSNTVFTDSYIRDIFAVPYFQGQRSDVLPKDGSKVKVTVEYQPPVDLSGGRPMMTWPPQEPVYEKKVKKLQWHAFDSQRYNVKLFRFATNLTEDRYGVIFWAATVVNCEEDIPNVRLAIGSNSASMWWVNGEEAVIASGDRRMVADDCASPRLTLKKGRNVIWGAIINGPGMSDFCARFIDEDGNPVRNITLTTK